MELSSSGSYTPSTHLTLLRPGSRIVDLQRNRYPHEADPARHWQYGQDRHEKMMMRSFRDISAGLIWKTVTKTRHSESFVTIPQRSFWNLSRNIGFSEVSWQSLALIHHRIKNVISTRLENVTKWWNPGIFVTLFRKEGIWLSRNMRISGISWHFSEC